MKVILVDCKYIGATIAFARKASGLRRMAAAQILGITYQDLLRYERGQALVPEHVMQRILGNGFILLRSKIGEKNN